MDTRTQAERDFHAHMTKFGSDGYPIMQRGDQWAWVECWGIAGSEMVYPTREAVEEAIELYISGLCDKSAGREWFAPRGDGFVRDGFDRDGFGRGGFDR